MDVNANNTILIVDDEPLCIHFLVHILQKDYTIFVAKNGKSAVEIASNHLPDLILLDVDMPDMNGYETLSKLRESEATKTIPAIFITGRDAAEDHEKSHKLGAVDFIPKTARPYLIKERVQNQIKSVGISCKQTV